MPNNIVDELFIALNMDTSGVEKAIDGTVNTVTNGLKNLLTSSIAPILSTFMSGYFVRQLSSEIDQVGKLSESLGVDIERLQAWQGSAELAGASASAAGHLFGQLNKQMTAADQKQAGALHDYIERGLLPAVRNAQGELKSTEVYALELADAFAAMDKQTATGVAANIRLDSRTVAWLQHGSGAINEQLRKIKQLGVYTKEDAKIAAEFNDAISYMTRGLKMLLMPVFRAITPLMKKMADAITYLSQHAALFAPALAALASVIGVQLKRSLLEAAAAAAKFANFLLASPWGLVVSALAGIGVLLDDFLVWLEGGQAAFGSFWEKMLGPLEEARKKWETFKASVSGFVSIAEKFFPFAAAVAGLGAAFKILNTGAVATVSILGGVVKTFGLLQKVFTALKAASAVSLAPVSAAVLAIAAAVLLIYENWETVSKYLRQGLEWLSSEAEKIRGFFGGIFDVAAEKWDKFQSSLKEGFSSVFSSAGEKWNDFTTKMSGGMDWAREKIQGAGNALSSVRRFFNGSEVNAAPSLATQNAAASVNNAYNTQRTMTVNQTNNFNNVSTPEQAAKAVSLATSDIVANADTGTL